MLDHDLLHMFHGRWIDPSRGFISEVWNHLVSPDQL